MDNAIKFSSGGTIRITTFLQKAKMNVKFEDEGVGVSKDYLKVIFEPFRQEHQGYTRSYEGNGLGLTLVKKYCELNKIKIDVKSKKGKGSTFTLTF
ncbi:MAG: ATP-binding protein [Ignavibacteriaceae bacterium]|nr:ATP-binding protein [Ignavibacteriaceae bacterium]